MTDNKIARAIVEKCDIFYDDSLLSKEDIIEKYLSFFAEQFDPDEQSLSFVFHTGSECFDAVSISALTIGCLSYEFSSNDKILSGLKKGDMVLYEGKRLRWIGIEEYQQNKNKPLIKYMVMQQDAIGKNGPTEYKEPYEKYKHKVKPYMGSSSKTDGRGIRKKHTNRDDFIASVLDIPLTDVPSTLDISVVVVADKNKFYDIYKHLTIRYNNENTVSLTDIVPISYYTSIDEQIQIGTNQSKTEAVIKVTNKVSTARDLVLNKFGNKVVGLMITNIDKYSESDTELNDLLKRRSLKFACFIAPYSPESCISAMKQYESAKIFACTKEALSKTEHTVKISNPMTEKLNRQVNNILVHETEIININGCWNWEQYKEIKETLYKIKQSDISETEKENFILSSIALINLFATSFFSMSLLENLISSGKIITVTSPKTRINELIMMSDTVSSADELCSDIINQLNNMYLSLYDVSPKETALCKFLEINSDKKIVIVVPKAYYATIFGTAFSEKFTNPVCVTANTFDEREDYNIIVSVGDITGKKFDTTKCFSAPKITMFLYEFENITFSFKKKKIEISERKINSRISGIKSSEYSNNVQSPVENDNTITEQTLQRFSELDNLVNEIENKYMIRKLDTLYTGSGESAAKAEVKYVGTFTTGEMILFSKFYSAVVFNQSEGSVTEKSPDQLVEGDILVFTTKDNYTTNIVDRIFNQLLSEGILDSDVKKDSEMALYWKKALKKYKNLNGLNYREVAEKLKVMNCSVQDVTIRQWLIEESHIIGPQNKLTMKAIAETTRDPNLLRDPDSYFRACNNIRSYRRKILRLISTAINDSLSNRQVSENNVFRVVFDNVERLSKILQLESIFESDNIKYINNGMVNRPITEIEV